jgi:hypothetical protein
MASPRAAKNSGHKVQQNPPVNQQHEDADDPRCQDLPLISSGIAKRE